MLPLGALPVGLARHWALLFMALADASELPCQLLRGLSYLGALSDMWLAAKLLVLGLAWH